MRDMSAFGLSNEPESVPGPASGQSALESGMLDMSAFGLSSEPEPQPEPHQIQPQPAQTGVETGTLDMSAFGLSSEPQPDTGQPGPSQPTRSAIDTGMLDKSAWGFDSDPAPAAASSEQRQPAAQSSLETGMLDMSVFGLTPEASRLPPLATRPGEEQSTAATSAVETGMLDMSAFGMGDDVSPAEPAAPQPMTPGRMSEPPRPAFEQNGSAAGRLGDTGSTTAAVKSWRQLEAHLPLIPAELQKMRSMLRITEPANQAAAIPPVANLKPDASAFSLLRLDAPEEALRPSQADTEVVIADGNVAAEAEAEAAAALTLPGLSRGETLVAVQLAQVAAEVGFDLS